ncbi:hypothetical protein MVEN_01683600 [Mycena venus]|uniref:F-box domain-containing protein n=1 Tax=Mycena venus TaxID=2733690 RepID=A0A8H7CQN7_9AGAR|nr:hypothetical protein MVEN_01683600 [Mycena venus]
MQSPFRGYLNTNYIPTDAEIDHIRAHLAPHETELARLTALIHDLTVQRDQIRDYIVSHRALISQPRRLPQDVLEEIFLACLPTDHNAVMVPAQPPLLLGRVCSLWRSIAFAMPRLWASTHISVSFVVQREERKTAMVDWLTRSAPLPLHISCDYWDGYHEYNPIISALLPFSPRWRALHISNMWSFHLLAGTNAPLLEDVQISFQHGLDDEILASKLFRGIKSGRVNISAYDVSALVPTTQFTWVHLTHLALESLGGDRGLDHGAAANLL